MRQNWWVITGYSAAVLVFIVVATYVTLFATGYKFDWSTKTLKKTGFLLVETYPKGASLKVAGRKSNPTPTTVKRLLPGDYLVEMSKDGYRDWSATLTVESGLVTEKRNTLLTFKELKPEVVLDKSVELMAVTNDRSRAAVVVGSEVLLVNLTNNTTSNILAPTLILQQVAGADGRDLSTAKINKLEFGPDNRMLLINSTGRRNQYHLLLNTDNGQMLLVAKGALSRSAWLNSNQLTWLQAGKLYLHQAGDKTPRLVKDGLVDYSVTDGGLYAVVSDKFGKHSLLRLETDGNSKTEAVDLPVAKTYRLAKLDGSWLLITASNGPASIWVSERASGTIKWNKYASNVTSEVWWDSNYLVYIAGRELMVADIKKKIEEATSVATATSWQVLHFSFDTLLFKDGNRLTSIDITGKNRYQLVEMGAQATPIAPQISQVLYIGPDKKLYRVKLREETTGLLNLSRFNLPG